MGQELVNGALVQYTGVPGPARVLLVAMALYAKDSDPAPRSYLGQKALCAVLGYQPTPGGTRNVRKYLRALSDAGAITRTRVGGRSHDQGAWRSEFVLNVRPVALSAGLSVPGPADPLPTGSSRPPTYRVQQTLPTYTKRPTQRDLHVVGTSSSSAPTVTRRWDDE